MMSRAPIFPWLVYYQFARYLPKYVEHVRPGENGPILYDVGPKIKGKYPDGRIKVGMYEGDGTGLIVSNQYTLTDKLIQEGIVHEADVGDGKITLARTIDDFLCTMDHQEDPDTSYVYAGGNMRDFPHFTTHHLKVGQKYSQFLPPNFRHIDDLGRKGGSKTKSAIKMCQHLKEHDVYVYFMNGTAFTELGLGRVNEMGPQGLVQSFYMTLVPQTYEGNVLWEDKARDIRVAGIWEHYESKGDHVEVVSSVDISRGLMEHLREANAEYLPTPQVNKLKAA